MNGLLTLLLFAGTVAASPHSGEMKNHRIKVYWNLPDRCSKLMKVDDYFSVLDQYDIIKNSGPTNSISGDKIAILYSNEFTHYAHLNSKKNYTEVAGGIPQKMNFSAFFVEARKTIEKHIPDYYFSGPAVLDFEEFRFMYQYNWGTRLWYQKKSDEYTAQKYPNLSATAVRVRSEREFDQSSRRFVLGLLRLAKKLRPFATWGYYLMPECINHHKMETKDCDGLADYSDRMSVLFREQTGIYPSIYVDQPTNATIDRSTYRSAQIRLREARRLSLSNKGRTPIFVYSKFEYDAYTQHEWYFEKVDLCATLHAAFEEGVQGIILWSPDRGPWDKRCPNIKNYIETMLGPAVRAIHKQADKCAKRQCSGHGTCYRIGELKSLCKWSMADRWREMACLCDEGYVGPKCAMKRPFHKKNPLKPFKKGKMQLLPLETSSTTIPPPATSPLPPTKNERPTFNEMVDKMIHLPPPF